MPAKSAENRFAHYTRRKRNRPARIELKDKPGKCQQRNHPGAASIRPQLAHVSVIPLPNKV